MQARDSKVPVGRRRMLAGLLTIGFLFVLTKGSPQAGSTAPGPRIPTNNLGGQMPPTFDRDVQDVVARLDKIEDETLSQMGRTTLDRQGRIRTLGRLLLFDKHLSVNQTRRAASAIRLKRDLPGRFNP
jgi:cytochrome c peroxidase